MVHYPYQSIFVFVMIDRFQVRMIRDLMHLVDDHFQMLQIVINVLDFQRNSRVSAVDHQL
jgi:hypothetical protein